MHQPNSYSLLPEYLFRQFSIQSVDIVSEIHIARSIHPCGEIADVNRYRRLDGELLFLPRIHQFLNMLGRHHAVFSEDIICQSLRF